MEEWVVMVTHFEGDRVVREWIGADKVGLFTRLGFSVTRGPHRA